MLDEVIPRDAQYHELEFDLHHDTRLFNDLRRIGTGRFPASHLVEVAQTPAAEGFPRHALQLRFIENHDFERYVEECGRASLKAAAAAVLTLPGIPMVYYGQERGVEGSWDEMVWSDGDTALTDYHRRLVATRNDHAVLRRGEFVEVEWEAESDHAVAYGRDDGDDRVIVVLNFDETPADVRLGESVQDTDLVTGDAVDVVDDAGDQRVTVDSVLVLVSG